jgi:hypothetical protein
LVRDWAITLLLNATAKLVNPRRGRLTGGGDVVSLGCGIVSGNGVRTEELHYGEMRLKIREAVGHDIIRDVSFELNNEAVVPETTLARTALEFGEVDVTRRETTEDAIERTRAVSILKTNN